MRRRAAALFLLLVLAGCAGPGTRLPADGQWADHRAQLAALTTWTATGKLALRGPGSAESATVVWRQSGAQTRIHLSGPLGAGATVIDSDGQLLTIQQNGQTKTFDIAEEETIHFNTGWALPLAALPHWLRGLPAPDGEVEAMELDAEGAMLRHLRQNGWDVRFPDYGRFDGYLLPTRVEVAREDSRATVIIRRWQAGTHR